MNEQFAMLSANLFGGALILILGLIIRTGKANFLIAGYNMMSEQERAKYDMDSVSRFLGRMLVVSAAVLFAGGALALLGFHSAAFIFASWAIFIAIILWMAAYMNTGNRFKKL